MKGDDPAEGLSPTGSDWKWTREPAGDALLIEAAGGDASRLAALRARVAAGEPAPYAAGFFHFRGRRFRIDRRAYITDPELTHLVDSVLEEGAAIEAHGARPPRVLEFGVGCGTLAISVQLEQPRWSVAGLDIDPDAVELAKANAAEHGAGVALLVSDFFSALPSGAPEPDIIFGDPPWGGPEDLYSQERDAAYYRWMPPRSAFPGGGVRCALHDQLIARVKERGWSSLLILNYGVLPRALVAQSAAALCESCLISPAPHLTVMVGRAFCP